MVDAQVKLPAAPTVPILAPIALSEMKVPDIAKAINERMSAMISSFRTSVQRAIEIGELLVEAKKRVGHGKFEKWLTTNTTIPYRSAARYMKFAKERTEIEAQLGKSANLADLNLTTAQRLLAPPKPPAPPEEREKKHEPTAQDRYTDIESALLKALLDLDYDLAKGCADRTIGALNDTVEDIESAQKTARNPNAQNKALRHTPRILVEQEVGGD
jgi:hypothetical protein